MVIDLCVKGHIHTMAGRLFLSVMNSGIKEPQNIKRCSKVKDALEGLYKSKRCLRRPVQSDIKPEKMPKIGLY